MVPYTWQLMAMLWNGFIIFRPWSWSFLSSSSMRWCEPQEYGFSRERKRLWISRHPAYLRTQQKLTCWSLMGGSRWDHLILIPGCAGVFYGLTPVVICASTPCILELNPLGTVSYNFVILIVFIRFHIFGWFHLFCCCSLPTGLSQPTRNSWGTEFCLTK